MRKFVSDNQKPYIEYYVKQILSQDRRKRINVALQGLADRQDWNKVKDSVKWSNLFENEEELTDFLCQHFGFYGEKNNPKEIVGKAFESGLLQRQKKTLTYLTLDPDPEKHNSFITY